MPNWFSNPDCTRCREGTTPARAVPLKYIAEEVKLNAVKLNCQLKFKLMVPSRSCLLLKWFTVTGAACTIWVGGGSFQVKLLPSEKSKASVSHLWNDFVS